jgi:hypothetical protein
MNPSTSTCQYQTNPLKEDTELKSLLKELEHDVTNTKQFEQWRNSFLSRFIEFLDVKSTENAEQSYWKFSDTMSDFVRAINKLSKYIEDGSISNTNCSVKARQGLQEVSRNVTIVVDEVDKLIPGTIAMEKLAGFTKFHMGAVLVRDGFREYARMSMCADVIEKMERSLKNVADKLILLNMNAYLFKIHMFCDIMADLGLLSALIKCREYVHADDDEEMIQLSTMLHDKEEYPAFDPNASLTILNRSSTILHHDDEVEDDGITCNSHEIVHNTPKTNSKESCPTFDPESSITVSDLSMDSVHQPKYPAIDPKLTVTIVDRSIPSIPDAPETNTDDRAKKYPPFDPESSITIVDRSITSIPEVSDGNKDDTATMTQYPTVDPELSITVSNRSIPSIDESSKQDTTPMNEYPAADPELSITILNRSSTALINAPGSSSKPELNGNFAEDRKPAPYSMSQKPTEPSHKRIHKPEENVKVNVVEDRKPAPYSMSQKPTVQSREQIHKPAVTRNVVEDRKSAPYSMAQKPTVQSREQIHKPAVSDNVVEDRKPAPYSMAQKPTVQSREKPAVSDNVVDDRKPAPYSMAQKPKVQPREQIHEPSVSDNVVDDRKPAPYSMAQKPKVQPREQIHEPSVTGEVVEDRKPAPYSMAQKPTVQSREKPAVSNNVVDDRKPAPYSRAQKPTVQSREQIHKPAVSGNVVEDRKPAPYSMAQKPTVQSREKPAVSDNVVDDRKPAPYSMAQKPKVQPREQIHEPAVTGAVVEDRKPAPYSMAQPTVQSNERIPMPYSSQNVSPQPNVSDNNPPESPLQQKIGNNDVDGRNENQKKMDRVRWNPAEYYRGLKKPEKPKKEAEMCVEETIKKEINGNESKDIPEPKLSQEKKTLRSLLQRKPAVPSSTSDSKAEDTPVMTPSSDSSDTLLSTKLPSSSKNNSPSLDTNESESHQSPDDPDTVETSKDENDEEEKPTRRQRKWSLNDFYKNTKERIANKLKTNKERKPRHKKPTLDSESEIPNSSTSTNRNESTANDAPFDKTNEEIEGSVVRDDDASVDDASESTTLASINDEPIRQVANTDVPRSSKGDKKESSKSTSPEQKKRESTRTEHPSSTSKQSDKSENGSNHTGTPTPKSKISVTPELKQIEKPATGSKQPVKHATRIQPPDKSARATKQHDKAGGGSKQSDKPAAALKQRDVPANGLNDIENPAHASKHRDTPKTVANQSTKTAKSKNTSNVRVDTKQEEKQVEIPHNLSGDDVSESSTMVSDKEESVREVSNKNVPRPMNDDKVEKGISSNSTGNMNGKTDKTKDIANIPKQQDQPLKTLKQPKKSTNSSDKPKEPADNQAMKNQNLPQNSVNKTSKKADTNDSVEIDLKMERSVDETPKQSTKSKAPTRTSASPAPSKKTKSKELPVNKESIESKASKKKSDQASPNKSKPKLKEQTPVSHSTPPSDSNVKSKKRNVLKKSKNKNRSNPNVDGQSDLRHTTATPPSEPKRKEKTTNDHSGKGNRYSTGAATPEPERRNKHGNGELLAICAAEPEEELLAICAAPSLLAICDAPTMLAICAAEPGSENDVETMDGSGTAPLLAICAAESEDMDDDDDVISDDDVSESETMVSDDDDEYVESNEIVSSENVDIQTESIAEEEQFIDDVSESETVDSDLDVVQENDDINEPTQTLDEGTDTAPSEFVVDDISESETVVSDVVASSPSNDTALNVNESVVKSDSSNHSIATCTIGYDKCSTLDKVSENDHVTKTSATTTKIDPQPIPKVSIENHQNHNKKPKKILTENERRKCYMWYNRLGNPTRERMKQRVMKMQQSNECDITVDDVDALPWIAGGTLISQTELNKLILK